MSIHSSLRSAGKGRRHRSVLKRHERLKILKEKGLWDEAKPAIGILKVKMQKLKVKKEKAAAAEGAAAAPGADAKPAAGASAAAAKPAAKSDKK